MRKLIVTLAIIGLFSAPLQFASADVSLPPKGVSQELWKAFQEIVIQKIDNADRNLKWSTSPKFYIAGNPTQDDNYAVQVTLNEIRNSCTNITPAITSTELPEGVLLHYIPVSGFKNIIPQIPSDVTTSYAWYTYYLNRGLTKWVTVISSDEKDQNYRTYLTQLRMLQGMGFIGATTNKNSNLFSRIYPSGSPLLASELDVQIIKLYCSTFIRSWDTAQQSFDAINSAWTKTINTPTSLLSIKVSEYLGQINFKLDFDPSTALDNQMTSVEYKISDVGGSVVKSGIIDVLPNLFKTYEVIIGGIKDSGRYTIEAWPMNSKGSGSVSKASGRQGKSMAPITTSSIGASDAAAEIVDARNAAIDSKNAALSALSDYARFQLACTEISSEFTEDIQNLFDTTSLSSYCREFDNDVASLKAKIGALDPAKAKTTDDANSMTDTANLYAEDADTFVAQIQDITDELSSTEKQFTLLIKTLAPLELVEISVIDSWSSLIERITIIPQSSQAVIKKSQNYKLAASYVVQMQKIIDSRDVQLELLSAVDRPSQLQPIINRLNGLKVSTSQMPSFKKYLDAINKSIPANVCQKGTTVLLPSKTGKCAKGFELIPTS